MTKLTRTASLYLAAWCLIPVSTATAGFGIAPNTFSVPITNPNGSTVTQAGSHPYEITTNFSFNTRPGLPGGLDVTDGNVKDISVALPAGFVGNPNATPRCAFKDFNKPLVGGLYLNACSANTQVGTERVRLNNPPQPGPFAGSEVAVFNLVPPPGVPAEFGFKIEDFVVLLTPSLRPGDNGLTVQAKNLTQLDEIDQSRLTFWGVPGDPSHDSQRQCTASIAYGCPADPPYKAFLRMPTSCTGPLQTVLSATSWQELDGVPFLTSYLSQDASSGPVGLDGCNKLPFAPTFTMAPDTAQADTPSGFTFDLKVPQDGLLEPGVLSTADIKNATVTLPRGVVVNPGQAAGLQACQETETSLKLNDGPPVCPGASRVGTVVIATPLLEDKLEGNVYILQSNPPDLKLLVAAEAAGDGVFLKLVGDVQMDLSTGQLVARFTNAPQLPFTEFKLAFSGGAQAALATPAVCGTYFTTSDFTPWSSPDRGDVFPSDSFQVNSGPGGSACVPSLPFRPVLHAGSSTDQAGGFSSFSLLLQRGDGQQRISTVQFKTPEGLLGMISRVPLCREPLAASGDCSAASEIGHTVVEAGPGPYPLVVPQPGQPAAPIYLTGGYKGAPYGLTIKVPLVVGPFTLQTQVVRARIEVDPHTAQLTITTDPLPSIIDGIPADLRTINAVVDRPGFIFNPTDCSPQAFSGTATSLDGTTAAISSHFQMGSCRSLTFKPNFKVSTAAKSSRKTGASLDAKIVYPSAPLGVNQATSQANIASVKVDLPKQLPSRLTTLQKACTAAAFDVNPASCPKASVVGHATAVSPVLPVALTGPVYFVSHGGDAFPQLVVVLQGYGVTVDLVGDTFISKKGITSSTFRRVPDVPIKSFELTLPQGPFSALAANLPAKAKGSFCGQKLALPTAFTGQNGAVIHQSTKITITGCPKHKTRSKTHKQTKNAGLVISRS